MRQLRGFLILMLECSLGRPDSQNGAYTVASGCAQKRQFHRIYKKCLRLQTKLPVLYQNDSAPAIYFAHPVSHELSEAFRELPDVVQELPEAFRKLSEGF